MPDRDFDCVVVGGGPGGLVSSLYLGRFRRSVALINAGKPRAAWIPRTHNLLGFPNGIAGTALLARLHRQIRQLGVVKIAGLAQVHRIPHGKGFKIEVRARPEAEPRVLRARKVILACGIVDNQPSLVNVTELRNRGLLRYCSICDAYEYRNQRLAVIACDDFGLQKALFLSHYTKSLDIVIPPDQVIAPRRIHELRQRRARVHRGLLQAIEPLASPRGIRVHLKAKRPFHARVGYVELGCRVQDSAFAHLKGLRRSKEGFLITTTEQRLSIPGLFAVGDCVNLLGQVSVAAGQAAVAATTIHNDLLDGN